MPTTLPAWLTQQLRRTDSLPSATGVHRGAGTGHPMKRVSPGLTVYQHARQGTEQRCMQTLPRSSTPTSHILVEGCQ